MCGCTFLRDGPLMHGKYIFKENMDDVICNVNVESNFTANYVQYSKIKIKSYHNSFALIYIYIYKTNLQIGVMKL